ncbi:hypothetical protein ACVETL_15705, partial [Acinetobacter baumannii]
TGDDGMSHFWDEKNEGSAELDELFDGGAASEAPADTKTAPAQ